MVLFFPRHTNGILNTNRCFSAIHGDRIVESCCSDVLKLPFAYRPDRIDEKSMIIRVQREGEV